MDEPADSQRAILGKLLWDFTDKLAQGEDPAAEKAAVLKANPDFADMLDDSGESVCNFEQPANPFALTL